jgi:hypothetical protein
MPNAVLMTLTECRMLESSYQGRNIGSSMIALKDSWIFEVHTTAFEFAHFELHFSRIVQ